MTITGIAHRQIGTHLRIPAAYYDRMREERPDLPAYNANTWFKQESSQRRNAHGCVADGSIGSVVFYGVLAQICLSGGECHIAACSLLQNSKVSTYHSAEIMLFAIAANTDGALCGSIGRIRRIGKAVELQDGGVIRQAGIKGVEPLFVSGFDGKCCRRRKQQRWPLCWWSYRKCYCKCTDDLYRHARLHIAYPIQSP